MSAAMSGAISGPMSGPMSGTNNGNISDTEKEKFSLISKESIQLIAQQNGYEKLSDGACLLLCEDVSYRLREVIHNSMQFMRHSKRRRLTCDDINRSLQWSDCEPVFGYNNNANHINNVLIKDAKVFVSEDPILNLNDEFNQILNSKVSNIKLYDDSSHLKLSWLCVEGKSGAKSEAKSGDSDGMDCAAELRDYYEFVTNAILATDGHLLSIALKDLSINSRIKPILSHLIHFISNAIQKLSHDICQLKRLLQTIRYLFINPSLYLATNSCLDVLTNSVLHCILEPLGTSMNAINDHWLIRDSAAHLLSTILHEWSTTLCGKQLKSQIIDKLSRTLLDFSKPFSCHYGAIIAFVSFGTDCVLQKLCPCLTLYWTHLLSSINKYEISNSQTYLDAQRVFGALLLVAQTILRKYRKMTIEDNCDYFSEIYNEFEDIFGDSLTATLSSDFELIRIQYYSEKARVFRKNQNVFSPSEVMQTGEELLDMFYEAAAHHSEEINSNLSAGIEDDNSYDDNSVISENEKETNATDVDIQIKSTISDPSLGIKLTIKKLRRDQQQVELKRHEANITSRSVKKVCDPVFESVAIKAQNYIRFNIRGATNKTVINKRLHQINFLPSKWFAYNNKNKNISKSVSLTKSKSKLKACLYSCNLFNIL